MKVSIIIPVYNASELLHECINSVISQSHHDFELIIVDDGSTDNSAQICYSYAHIDKRIKIIHQDNKGQSAARNAGLSVATGQTVTFLDADDQLHPKYLETLLSHYRPGSIVNCGTLIGKQCKWPDSIKHDVIEYTPQQAIEATLYQHRLLSSVWGKIYPAEIFKDIKFTETLWYEDLDIIYRLYEAVSSMVYIDCDLYFYRKNPTSFINTFNTKRLDVLKVTDKIEQHYKDDPIMLRAAMDRKFSANCNMYILTSRASMHDTADKCWQTIKAYRSTSLKNPKVRLKNKLGALLTYLGRRPLLLLAPK